MPLRTGSLFTLDRLPGHCSVEAVMNSVTMMVRFRAIQKRRWRRDLISAWSGEFFWDGTPIVLVWDAFDFVDA